MSDYNLTLSMQSTLTASSGRNLSFFFIQASRPLSKEAMHLNDNT